MFAMLLLTIITSLVLGWPGPARADRATLIVKAGERGARISPMLYGIFFEEINHAGDGGLYAELVRNRSFEEAETPQGWSLVTAGGAGGEMSLDTARPLNERNRHSLRLSITKAATGRVGVANGGYWGISVSKGRNYLPSFHARCSEDFKGALIASLENAAGRVYARQKLAALSVDWKRFTCALTPKGTEGSARLVLSASARGTVWLDMVSLFPEDTYKRRSNGLRTDVARMLAGLKPSFVRFPGGCFVEGDKLENAFRWKDTVGDNASRRGHWNLWGYRSTDGLGYHEYLQMCEDLGAQPLFVINCGMSHAGNVPMEQLDSWVQDALDAIEYANGPVSTKWGSLRAKSGHPKPFGLKLMEIGNENGGPAYEERYARFHDAIKARYPEVQLVANAAVNLRPMDVLDEHYYSSPEWFASQSHRYDSYARKGHRIYVGEYACTQNCGQGNLRAALAEAAFMTGLERNSDLVVMASYAPLLVNVNNRAWNPDSLCFDSAHCYGTPSYYVQKLFSLNRGDVVLPGKLACETKMPQTGGAIGLGTWRTQAEFRDIKVTKGDRTLFSSDYTRGSPGWRVIRGEWKTQDEAFRQTGTQEDLRAVAGDTGWTEYTLTLRARKLAGDEGFLIMFRVRDDNNWLWWNLGGWGNVRHGIEKCSGGGKSMLGEAVAGRIETGRWYDIKVEAHGQRLRCYLDGNLIHDVEDRGPEPMAAVASRINATHEIVLKVVNVSEECQDTEVKLEGVGRITARGTATVLTADSPEDENSFSQPTKVAPVVLPLQGVDATFRYTFLPHSLTLLRLKQDQHEP